MRTFKADQRSTCTPSRSVRGAVVLFRVAEKATTEELPAEFTWTAERDDLG